MSPRLVEKTVRMLINAIQEEQTLAVLYCERSSRSTSNAAKSFPAE
jgi:hypothetical protein